MSRTSVFSLCCVFCVCFDRIAHCFLQLYDRRTVCHVDEEENHLSSQRHCFVNYVKSGQIELLMRLLRSCGVPTADLELEFTNHAEHIPT